MWFRWCMFARVCMRESLCTEQNVTKVLLLDSVAIEVEELLYLCTQIKIKHSLASKNLSGVSLTPAIARIHIPANS